MSDMSDHKRLGADPELAIRNLAHGGHDGLLEQLNEDTSELLKRFQRQGADYRAADGDDRAYDLRAAERALMAELWEAPGPPVRLHYWLKFDFLTAEQALPLIIGYCLDFNNGEVGYIRLDGLRLFNEEAMASIHDRSAREKRTDFNQKLWEIEGIWKSRGPGPQLRPLSDYIAWAKTKEYVIDWLDWAADNGYRDIVTTSDAVGIFDPFDPHYSSLLHVACQAWTAVSNSFVKGKPKPQIEQWLRTEQPKLSSTEFKAIAIICNWDKRGGRPPTST